MNSIETIASWYKKNVRQDEPNTLIINIESLDNPGWWVTINLKGTDFEKETFSKIENEKTQNDWIKLFVRTSKFEGFGDPFKLDTILKCFGTWINGASEKVIVNIVEKKKENWESIFFLETWYENNCDENWEHLFGVDIIASENKWTIKIDLTDTFEENKNLNEISSFLDENNWIKVYRDKVKNQFIGEGDLSKLNHLLVKFKNFVEA